MSIFHEGSFRARLLVVPPAPDTLRKEIEAEIAITKEYTKAYYTWNVMPDLSLKRNDKRHLFLRSLFGNCVEQLPAFVEQARTFGADDGVRLPLFRLGQHMVTAKGFGGNRARKLKTFESPPTVVMGVCLWNANWQLVDKNSSVYRLVLQTDRDRVNSICSGEFALLRVPNAVGLYQRRIISLQREVLTGLRQMWPSCRVVYHLPFTEYLRFVRELPVRNHVRIRLEDRLCGHCDQVRQMVVSELGLISFVDPLEEDPFRVKEIQQSAKVTPEIASFLYPYCEAHEWCVGVEDMVEYSLPSRAERLTNRQSHIVCLFGLLGFPHPYMDPSVDEVCEEIVL